MAAELNKDLISLFKTISEYSSILIVVIGILVLIGWAFDIALLKSPGSGFSTIKSNVGFAFILMGISLWLQQTNRVNQNNRRIAQVLALAAALIGFLTLTEYAFNVNIGIDQILFKEAAGALNTSSPNRMALSAAISLFVAGIAIAFIDIKISRNYRLAQILALIGGSLSLLALMGYAYNSSALYYIPQYTGIALYAALTLGLIFLSIFLSRPGSGIMAMVTSDSIAGVLTRRLLPAVIILPFMLGLIWQLGAKANLYDQAFGYALFAFSAMIFLLLLLWGTVIPINRIDNNRKRAEEEIQKLANIVESSDDAIISKSLDGFINSWNNGAEMAYGYSADEIMGKSISLLEPDEIDGEIENLMKMIRHGEKVRHYETKRLKKDGTIIDVSITLSPVFNTSGELVAISTIARDITEKKLAEAEKQRLLEQAQQMAEELEVSNEELQDVTEELQVSNEELQNTTEELQVSNEELQQQRDDLLDLNQALKVSEKRLKLSNIYNRSLLEASVDPLVTIGPDGKITDVNNSTESVTGLTRNELIGTDFSDYFTEPGDAREGYKLVFKEGMVRDYPLEIQHEDGHITPVLYNASVYRDESGEVIGVFAAARDITERKLAEAERQKLLEKAQRVAEELEASNEELQDTTQELQVSNEELQDTTEELQVANEELQQQRDDLLDLNQALKKGESDLKLSNIYNRSLLEASVDPLVTIGPDGRITDVNESTELVTGYSRSKIIGTDFSDYFTEPDKARDGYQQVFQEGTVIDYPLEIQHKDGHVTPVLYNASVYRDESGEVIGVFAAARDITELKKAEDKIRLSYIYNRSLLEASVDPLVTIGPDGRITDVNESTELVTGYSRSRIIGTDFSDYFTKPEGAREGYKLVFKEGMVRDYPLEIQHKDGHVTPVLYNASVYRDESGEVIGVFAAARDITERKLAEAERQKLLEKAQRVAEELEASNEELQSTTEELQATNEELTTTTRELKEANVGLKFASEYNRSLLEASVDPLVTIGPDGRITDVNESTELVTGYSRSRIIGTDFSDYFTKPEEAREGYKLVFKEGMVRDYPLEIQHKDGHVTPVLYNASVYRDESGEVIGVFAAARDMTERKKAEDKLKFANAYNRSLLESSLDPLVTIGADGKITDVNESTEFATGYSREELIGTDFSDYFTEPEKAREGYRRVFREGLVRDYELNIKNKNGQIIPVLYNASIYKDESDKVMGVFAAARDITERKKAEELLNLKIDELARSNAELEQFAYVSSHDLQEPLRMIGSYLQLLERRYQGQLDEKADKYIHFAVDGSARMQNLINDLLEFSRVTTRAKDLELTNCESIYKQVLSNLEVSIKENDASITHDPLPEVMADDTQLTQVFQNLISNALKFRSEDNPKIHISARKEEAQWVFSVKDNGIGIDPKHSERIFEVFKRLHKRREYPGTGIGLSICKKIIERHGGHIWVESEPGKGSTFYFTIPRKR